MAGSETETIDQPVRGRDMELNHKDVLDEIEAAGVPLTASMIADRVGKSKKTVYNRIDEIQDPDVDSGEVELLKIEYGNATAFASPKFGIEVENGRVLGGFPVYQAYRNTMLAWITGTPVEEVPYRLAVERYLLDWKAKYLSLFQMIGWGLVVAGVVSLVSKYPVTWYSVFVSILVISAIYVGLRALATRLPNPNELRGA